MLFIGMGKTGDSGGIHGLGWDKQLHLEILILKCLSVQILRRTWYI